MVNVSANAVKEAEQDLLNPSRYSFSLAQVSTFKIHVCATMGSIIMVTTL